MALVVAGYLMRALALGPDQAVVAVAARREIHIATGLVELLFKLES